MTSKDSQDFRSEEEILHYHERAPAGKISTALSKPVETQQDLAIAYSPGVALPCLKIHEDVDNSFRYTGRGNLVGVISNGSAVLGLGNIGPYAAKPVMEGKAMLFKKFADIDVFDIELDAEDSDAFIAAVKALEPTFGGINLEDIKAPECFYIEERLRAAMSIPVFHDDQHGTAIIAAAAFINALEVTEKVFEDVRVVFSGSGAAAIACASLFLSLGLKPENLIMCDSKGVLHTGRRDLNPYKERFSRDTSLRTLGEALVGADAFIGVSVANVLTPEMITAMAPNPIIFALANPDPEIHPDVAKKVRPDAIIATGRSDFPNQVNNVLGFPFIFRGALDVRATVINEEMKLAAVYAIAALAKKDVPDAVMRAYKEKESYKFGRDYLIPKPVDPRVLFYVAPAVAKAAMDSGVARRMIDMHEYKEHIQRVLGPTQQMMRSLRREIRQVSKISGKAPLIVIPHAYDRRILKATAEVAADQDVRLCLLGEKSRILNLAEAHGLKNFDKLVEIVDPLHVDKLEEYAAKLFELRQRKGVSRTGARQLINNHNYLAAMMLHCGDADGLISGVVEPYSASVRPILETIGTARGSTLAGIYIVMINNKQYYFADCTITIDPDAQTLADIAMTTAHVASLYGQDPVRVAMLSSSSFGSTRHPKQKKVAEAVEILRRQMPSLEVDGEMQADVALDCEMRAEEFPFCQLQGDPNVLIFPDLDSANISYKLLANMADAHLTGPIIVGLNKPANVMQRSATTEEIINMIYVTAHQAVTQMS